MILTINRHCSIHSFIPPSALNTHLLPGFYYTGNRSESKRTPAISGNRHMLKNRKKLPSIEVAPTASA